MATEKKDVENVMVPQIVCCRRMVTDPDQCIGGTVYRRGEVLAGWSD